MTTDAETSAQRDFASAIGLQAAAQHSNGKEELAKFGGIWRLVSGEVDAL